MLAGSGIVIGRVSHASDWSQTLEASANAAYTTNPALVPGSNVADQSAQLSIDGNTTAQSELDQLTLTPRLSITRFARETGLDYQTAAISLAYQHTLERGQWSLNGQVLTDSTLTSELGLTGITEINRHHDAGTLSVGYQYLSTERLSWNAQASWQDTRYTDAQQFGLTNYRYWAVQFGPLWNFTDRLVGELNFETDQISPQSQPSEKDYSATLELRRKLSEQYSWRISAGATRVQTPGAYDTTSSVFEVGAKRQTERVQWDVAIKRSVLPIGLGLLAREDQATATVAVSTSERSTLNLSLSVLRTDPVSLLFYLDPQISFSYLIYAGASWGAVSGEWRYNFSPHWALSLAFTQSRARNNDVPQWANGNQARLGVVWQSGRL